MKLKEKLFFLSFQEGSLDGPIEAGRYRRGGITVGNLGKILDTVLSLQKDFWIEIFDATTGERLAGPVAPRTNSPMAAEAQQAGRPKHSKGPRPPAELH